jgi:hypothetical protein
MQDAKTRYIRGVLACWEGNLELAVSELEAALRLDPALRAAEEALSQIR